MSQQHPHPYHHDYKSSTTSPSTSSASSSTSASDESLTRSLHHLELDERPYHYATSQYVNMPHEVTRSIGVAAFTEGPLFRSVTAAHSDPDLDHHNAWQTSASHSKDLSLNQGYSRGQDTHFLQQQQQSQQQQQHTSTAPVTWEDTLRQQLTGVTPTENPGYVEACYYFKFSSAPVELLLTLLKILSQLRVDTQLPDPSQFKVVCRAYRDGLTLPFIVRIWRPIREQGILTTNEYWCEFQRRAGDIVHFSEIYHQCVQAISTGDVESACIPPKKILVGIDDIPASSEELTETLKCLMNMASSPCNDIKTQAILALSEMSSQNDTIRDLILDNGGLETFLKSLMNNSEDVQRGATSGLANLATGTRADRVASTFTADSSRLARLSYNANSSQQLIRESARALHNIGLALGASRCDAAFRSTVKSFTATDPQAKQHIHQLAQTLQIY